MKKTESEREADNRAKKAIAKVEMMKLKRQQKVYKTPESNSMSMGTKVTIIVAVVLGIIVYMRQHTPEETKFSFADAKAYCMEQGKMLPLTLDDDPEHFLNLHALEGKAYWSAEGKLLYNMDLGHQSYPRDAKHYVVCVTENGKTGATPIGGAAYKYDDTTHSMVKQ